MKEGASVRAVIRISISFFLPFLLCAGTMAGATTSPDANELTVIFRLRNDVVSLHEPIVLELVVRNGLAQPVKLELGMDSIEFFRFSLTTPHGQSLEGPPRHNEGFYSQGHVVVAPGDEYKQELLLTQWFQFSSVGTYNLRAELALDIDIGQASKLRPETFRAQIQVAPRDATRLEKICAELASRVQAAPNAQSAQEPALELSYVEDPIAVPYLAQILSARKLVERFAVEGLDRVGNSEAVHVLVAALNDNYDDVAMLARQTLKRIHDRSSDPKAREAIEEALGPSGQGSS